MLPLPLESSNLSVRCWTHRWLQALPVPAFAAAPIDPATCVPCPKSSDPPATHVPLMHVKPWEPSDGFVQRLPCKSGCVKSIPVSMTPTTTSFESVCVSQAGGQEILVMSHC